jgi:IS30 family transposase
MRGTALAAPFFTLIPAPVARWVDLLTLVERSTRYVLLAPLPHRHTAELARDQLTRLIGTLPATLRRSLTYDRGSEMASTPSSASPPA